MENAFITLVGNYWIVEGEDTGIEYAACETLPEAKHFCKDMVIEGELLSYTVNE